MTLGAFPSLASTTTISGTSGDDEIYIGRLQTRVYQPIVGFVWQTNGDYVYKNGTLSQLPAGTTGVAVSPGNGSDYVEFLNSTDGAYYISSIKRLVASPNLTDNSIFKAYNTGANSIFIGSNYDDSLACNGQACVIFGRAGDDFIWGSFENEAHDFPNVDGECYGDSGDDTISCDFADLIDGGTHSSGDQCTPAIVVNNCETSI